MIAALGLALMTPAADAAIPKASYKLNLEPYQLDLVDYRFPSGLRVIFQSERTQPIVAITSAIDRGSEYDQDGYEGIAHVVEHLAFRAQHGDLPKNMDLIKELGGAFNASTSWDWTNYMTIAPIDSAIPLIKVEALRLKDGVHAVTEEDVRTESEIARNELRFRYENAAVGAAWDALSNKMVPKGHPYERPTIGWHDTLSNLDLEHVQEFVGNNYVPDATTWVIVGDFALEDTWPLLMKSLDGDEDLLMAQEDADKFNALKTENQRISFLEDWYPTLGEFMKAQSGVPYEARSKCDERAEPPMPRSTEPAYVRGQVTDTTVVLAWLTPGGYCSDFTVQQMSARLLANTIYLNLFPNWEYAKQDSPLEGFGCFANRDEYFSSITCYIETKASADLSPEKLIRRAADTLSVQWDTNTLAPEIRQFVDWNFNYARMSGMQDELNEIDVVASLGGRATSTAMQTHYTGDAAVFSDNIKSYNNIDVVSSREFAIKHLTRDRMVAAIVDPLTPEERMKIEAKAGSVSRTAEVQGYHATQDEDKFTRLFTAEDLTPEAIEGIVVKPDRAKIREFTLENGLKVAVVPHGQAPLVRVGLQVFGGDGSAPKVGLDYLGENLYGVGRNHDERLLAVAGTGSRSGNYIWTEGSSGNLDALLQKARVFVEDYDWQVSYKKRRADDLVDFQLKSARDPKYWADDIRAERLFPNHPAGVSVTPDDIRAAKDYSNDEFKNWIYRKWQPANAQLVVVGKIDPEDAEDSVRRFFGSWAKQPGVPEGKIPDWEIPTESPDRQVLVFDAASYTQTQVDFACQINRKSERDRAKGYIVGDVISELIWRKLREEAGVTYGAFAYASLQFGGTSSLNMSSLVQNDAAGLAAETMFALAEQAAKGDVDADAVAGAKWSRARQYGLGIQSTKQMANRLLGTRLGSLDYFDYYPKTIGAVQASDFPEVMAPCLGHEVLTMVGPASEVVPQLEERGIPHEVIDWEPMLEASMSKKQLKEMAKWRAAMATRADDAVIGGVATARDEKAKDDE